MKRKISISAALVIGLFGILISYMITGSYYREKYETALGDSVEINERFNKLVNIDELVRANNIVSVDSTLMNESLIRGYIAGIGDEKAVYFDEKAYKEYRVNLNNTTAGVGLYTYFNKKDGNAYIYKVIEGSQAEREGIQVGDRLYTVSDTLVTADNYYKLIESFSGNIDSVVNFTTLRGSEMFTYTIPVKELKIPTIEFNMINTDTALIRINSFGTTTFEDFTTGIEFSKLQGASKYIFDLRNNLGGDYDTCIKILDSIMPGGAICRIKSVDDNIETVMSDDNKIEGVFVTVVNENTSGEAELFAAALKDAKLAKVVGVVTHGQGRRQTVFPLDNDKTAIRISTHLYLPPFSDSFDGVGVKPDVEIALTDADEALFTVGQLGIESDAQIQKALSIFENN